MLSPAAKDRIAWRLHESWWWAWALVGVGVLVGGWGVWDGWVWTEPWGSHDVRVGASFEIEPEGEGVEAQFGPWRLARPGEGRRRLRIEVSVWRAELGAVAPYARHFSVQAEVEPDFGPEPAERDALINEFIRSRTAANPADWPPGLSLSNSVTVELGSFRHALNAAGLAAETAPVRLGLLLTGAGLGVFLARRATRGWIVGRCLACGYDLKGLAGGVCPECGGAGA